ncbi:chorion peroxidase-like [Tigriopus californicus]|nr:chorion peroxidase-like [Tigriopus californicus]
MLMQWGQILDHDITSTPMIRGLNGSILDCSGCQSNGRHPGCYPILVPRSDKFFPVREARSGQRKCIPFTRSLPGQTKLGPREQINQNTAYVDASHLYGSHPCRLEDLRLHRNGRMRVLEHPRSKIFKNLMPRNNENDECRSPIGLCFHTGDDRNNEQPGLTSIHTLLLREHNRLADQLQAVNPLWNDEKTFQEARKILMAINQHISYNEFLPRVLGTEITRAFGLTAAEGYYHKYNPDCTADVHNEFATAAFRFGHSLIRPMFAMFSATMKKMNDSGVRLRDHFNNPDVVYGSHFIDQILRGMVMNPMEQFDNTISDELTNHLFQERGKQFSGMDLASLNIQRGRDHGLPGYTKYRRLCLQKFESRKFNQHPQGLFQQIRELKDLHHIFRPDVAQIVARLYRHVDDIDLFTGGLSEIPLEGAVVGPTFACLIADQFEKLRQCDRFWFESPDEHIQFSLEQLQEIRKVTLGSLICRNCDLFAPMPRNVFDIPDDVNNPMEDCQNHPMIDIAKWNDPKASSSSRGGRGFNVVVPFCDFEGRVALPGSKVRTSACVKCECNSDEICSTLKFDNCADLIEDVGPFAVTVDPNCSQECRSQAQAKILQSSTL